MNPVLIIAIINLSVLLITVLGIVFKAGNLTGRIEARIVSLEERLNTVDERLNHLSNAVTEIKQHILRTWNPHPKQERL